MSQLNNSHLHYGDQQQEANKQLEGIVGQSNILSSTQFEQTEFQAEQDRLASNSLDRSHSQYAQDKNLDQIEKQGDSLMKNAVDFKIEIEVDSNGQQIPQMADILCFQQSDSSSSSAFNQNPSCPSNTQQNANESLLQEELDDCDEQIEESFLSPFNQNKISQIEVYHQQPFPEIPSIPKSLHDDSFLMELDDVQDEALKNIQSNVEKNNQINHNFNSSESNISTPDSDSKITNEQKTHQEIFGFNPEKNINQVQNFEADSFDNEPSLTQILQENFIPQRQSQSKQQSINFESFGNQDNSQQQQIQHQIIIKLLNTNKEKVTNSLKSVLNPSNAKSFLSIVRSSISAHESESSKSQLVKDNLRIVNELIQEVIQTQENDQQSNQNNREIKQSHQTISDIGKYSGQSNMFMGQAVSIQDDCEGIEEIQYGCQQNSDAYDQQSEIVKEQGRIKIFEEVRDSVDKKIPELLDNQFTNNDQQKGRNHMEKVIDFDWQPLDKFRAKLYTLDQEGRWHDRGTGNFKIEHVGFQQYKMTLLQEQDNQIDLLKNEIIEPHITFHRQRETIITWSDKQREQDLAVSFQNNSGAQYTWQKICQILDVDPDQNTQDSQNQEEDVEEFSQITHESLPRLAEELKNVQSIDNEAKQEICDHFLTNDSQKLIKLGELFEECENEMKDRPKIAEENLLNFFHIYKGLIQLNDERLLEILMSDKFYLCTFGALEWDPDGLEEVSDNFPLQQEDQQTCEPEFETLPLNDKQNLIILDEI